MAANIWKTGTVNAFNTTLDGAITDSDTTINLTMTTGLQYPGVIVVDRIDANDQETPLVREYISYTGISGSALTGCDRSGLGGSTAQEHTSGAKVEEVWSITHWNDFLGTFDVDHDSDGTHNLASGANIKVDSVDPWRTVSIFGGMKPTTTNGCASKETEEAATNDIDYDVLDFGTLSDERAFVNFQMPDSWDAGVVQFRYVWTNASGLTTETVTLELSGRSCADSDAIDQAVGTAVEVADTWIAQGDVHISAWSGNVTLAGTPAAGEYVHFEIMRDVSEDNLTGDARLMDIQIRYKQEKYSD